MPAPARASDAIALAVASAIAFVIGALVWPIFPGRDAQTYLMYFLEMERAHPVFPLLMLFRTPGAPLFFGAALATGQPLVAEAMIGTAFVIAIISVYLAGCFASRSVGLSSAGVLLLYPSYNALYHEVSSDGLFAFALAVWFLVLCAAIRASSARAFIAGGVFSFILVMVRPSSTILLMLACVVVLFQEGELRRKLRNAAVMGAAGATLIAGLAGYNKVRYGELTICRPAVLNVPFFRLFALDRLIRPENGPASRALIGAIQSDLLRREPYRSYGVTLDYFLNHGGRNMAADIGPMSDRVWGWNSEYRVVRMAAREAILAHPDAYAKGVLSTALATMRDVSYAPVVPPRPQQRTIRCELACVGSRTVTRNGIALPAPYYADETIPQPHSYWLESTPDTSVWTDWSNLAAPRLAFKSPDQARAFDDLSAGLSRLMRNLPPRTPIGALMKVANLASEVLPAMSMWLVVGLIGLLLNRSMDRRLLGGLAAIAAGVILINALGLPPNADYRLPFDPVFILFGVSGITGLVTGRLKTARGA
jgi:hypothetical protein